MKRAWFISAGCVGALALLGPTLPALLGRVAVLVGSDSDLPHLEGLRLRRRAARKGQQRSGQLGAMLRRTSQVVECVAQVVVAVRPAVGEGRETKLRSMSCMNPRLA